MMARVLAMVLLAAASCAAQQGPLLLDEVLASVEKSFPLLRAAVRERAIAEAGLLSAQGEFDLKIKSKVGTEQFGFYRNRTFDAYLEQPLQQWGATVFSGFDRGQGNYGPWNQDQLTLSRGEWRGGVQLPLFRDREVDRRRTDLRLADLDRALAGASIDKQRIVFYKAASKTYWEWVASGVQVRIARGLLALAEARIEAVAETIRQGQAAPIEQAENQRAILQRQSQLVQARRQLQNAGIELSLFLRDDAGQPLMAEESRVPLFPEPAPFTQEQLEADLSAALSRRPELRALLVKKQQAGAELRLAHNQTAPSVDLVSTFSRDWGSGSITKVGSEVKAGVVFELPLQRRKALGKVAAQEAKIGQLDDELAFGRDRVVADVRDAAGELIASRERLILTRQEVEVSRQLEEAERVRFALGDSTLFIVNLRELATADSEIRETKAQADYFKALAEYRAAIAGF